MADVIKHTFRFQEARKTQFLNLANKDDYGRHRGAVLYGMRLTPNGTTVTIGSGAIYTPYGTKFYFDVAAALASGKNVVDISAVQVDTFGTSVLASGAQTGRPYCVGVFARVQFDATKAPKIEAETEVDPLAGSTISFRARLLPFSREKGHPTYNLLPLDPVGMATQQSPAQSYHHYETLSRAQDGSGVASAAIADPPGGDADVDSIANNEVLLGYIIVGAPEGSVTAISTTLGVTTWNPGIVYVPCRNLVESIEDFLGLDVVLGRIPGFMGRKSSTAGVAGTALNQLAGKFEVAGTDHVPLMSPRHGTTAPSPSGDPWAVAWTSYRLPNFLRDGDQLIWSLRRLDYCLRLWMDRTGDQSLVQLWQDNATLPSGGAGLGTMAPMAKILLAFDGLNVAAANNNVLSWPDVDASAGNNAASQDAFNQPLKSGLAAHVPPGLTGAQTSLYGDSHAAALSALHLSISHILGDIFGFGLNGRQGVKREWLRQSAVWSSGTTLGLQHTGDGPVGHLPTGGLPDANRPTLGGTAATGYLSDERIYDAIAKIAARSEQSASRNWLRNGVFAVGAATSGIANSLPYWSSVAWARTILVPTLQSYKVAVGAVGLTAGLSALLWQRIDSLDAGLGSVITSAKLLGVSAALRVTAGTVRIAVYGRQTDDTVLFSARSQPIAVNAALVNHAFVFTVPSLGATLAKIDVCIEGDTVGTNSVEVGGLWFGPGAPVGSPVADTLFAEFLSRDGGTNAAMRGALYMGAFQVKNAANGTDPQDLVTKSQLDATLASANTYADAGDTRLRGIGFPGLSSSFVSPAGVANVYMTLVGGGGSGGSSGPGYSNTDPASGGGGSGGVSRVRIPVNILGGDVIAWTIGAGGIGPAGGFVPDMGVNGLAGGDTIVTLNGVEFARATGGLGGGGATTSSDGNGGAGGQPYGSLGGTKGTFSGAGYRGAVLANNTNGGVAAGGIPHLYDRELQALGTQDDGKSGRFVANGSNSGAAATIPGGGGSGAIQVPNGGLDCNGGNGAAGAIVYWLR